MKLKNTSTPEAEFIKQVKKIAADYSIQPAPRSNDAMRRRITILLKDCLMLMPYEQITDLVHLHHVRCHSLSDLERIVYLADVFEAVLYAKLQNENLVCDPLEADANKNHPEPLKLTSSKYLLDELAKFNMAIVDKIIATLKGESNGSSNLEKHTHGTRPNASDRTDKKRNISTDNKGNAVPPCMQGEKTIRRYRNHKLAKRQASKKNRGGDRAGVSRRARGASRSDVERDI